MTPLQVMLIFGARGGGGVPGGKGETYIQGGLVFTVLPEVLVFQFSLIFRNSPIFSYFSWKIW